MGRGRLSNAEKCYICKSLELGEHGICDGETHYDPDTYDVEYDDKCKKCPYFIYSNQ